MIRRQARSAICGLAALAVAVTLAAVARSQPGVGGLGLGVYYGPTCHKDSYGGTRCQTTPADGVVVTLSTYPGGRKLGRHISVGIFGDAGFDGPLPFGVSFAFRGRAHGRLYQGSWHLSNLQPLSGQTIGLALLLCPSGAWVATIQPVADDCSQRGAGVIAFGYARGAA